MTTYHQLSALAALDRGTWVLGIDPGLKGAMVALGPDDQLLIRWADGADGYLGPRAHLEAAYPRALASMQAAIGQAPTLTVVEAVQLRPHQGLHSQARAAFGIGLIVGSVATRGWAWEQPTPAHWHQTLGIPQDADPKAAVMAWCERRLPNLDLCVGNRRKPHDGVADAAALAVYGRLILGRGRNPTQRTPRPLPPENTDD